jgi:hypothetical protein
MHEINELRQVLGNNASMTMARFRALTNGESGTLHLQAWKVGIEKAERLRAGLPP